jgi:hypothetical protein
MLVDVLERGRYRYRLVGTALQREQGVNATGRYLDEVIPGADYKAHIIGFYDECLRERRPLCSERQFLSLNAQTADYHVKALLMPLSDDESRINMVVVVALFEYLEQEAQHRHFLDPVPYREIVRVLVREQITRALKRMRHRRRFRGRRWRPPSVRKRMNKARHAWPC